MKFIKNKKKILVINGVASLILILFLVLISVFNKDVKLDEVKLRHNGENSGMFAIMLEQEEGVYELSTSKSWPQSFYKFNESKSGCQDKMGNKLNNSLEYSPFDNIVTLKTKTAALCYLYFDRRVDLEINVETDGEVDVLPTTLGYKKEITCDGGSTPTWNYKYNRLEFADVLGTSEKCSLKYTTDNSDYTTNYLNQMIMDMAVEGTTDGTNQADGDVVHEVFYEVDYTNTEALPQDKYGYTESGKLDIYIGTNLTATEGTAADEILNYTDEQWVFDNEKLTTSKFYHISTKVQETGFYQFCYNIAAGVATNAIYVEVNGVRQKFGTLGYARPTTTAGVEGCIELGRLNKDDHVKVIRRAVQNATYPFPAASFSLRESTSSTSVDTGYRYEGKNPANYIWFNNELWRIIGVIDVKLEDGTTEKLTKIMRDIPYVNYGRVNLEIDASADGRYYQNEINSINKKFVPKVYWNNIGMSSVSTDDNYYVTNTFNIYETEIARAEKLEYFGRLSLSDFGFAAKVNSNCTRNTLITGYSGLGCKNSNWLYGYGNFWLYQADSSTSTCFWRVAHTGTVASMCSTQEAFVYPVVYLKSQVYVIDGSGRYEDPFIIGIKEN